MVKTREYLLKSIHKFLLIIRRQHALRLNNINNNLTNLYFICNYTDLDQKVSSPFSVEQKSEVVMSTRKKDKSKAPKTPRGSEPGGTQNNAERKRVEEALWNSELRYRRLFETAQDGILIIDADTGCIIDVNPFLVELLGYSFESFKGKQIWELGFFKDIISSQDKFAELLREKYIRYEDIPLETADGRKIEVEFVSNVYEVDTHSIIQCNIRDIADRRIAEKALQKTMVELERSNKELEQFAYVASHDLQEPLRMISSFTQLLAKRYQGKLDKDADEYIKYTVDSANRLQKMIQDLLSYSRITTRGSIFNTIDANSALGQAVSNLSMTIRETGALVTNDELPTVAADQSQLALLFQNLISNAIKFHGDDPPRIHIAAKKMGEEWEFSVRDNGIGIEPQYFERIFVIFQRLHTGDQYPGTGIGLALCNRIVQRHGGKIWVESKPGKGSTFYFTLKNKEA